MPHAPKLETDREPLFQYDTAMQVERQMIAQVMRNVEPTCGGECLHAASYALLSLRAWATMTSATAMQAWVRQAKKFLDGERSAVQPWQAPLLRMEEWLAIHALTRPDSCICGPIRVL